MEDDWRKKVFQTDESKFKRFGSQKKIIVLLVLHHLNERIFLPP